MSKPRWLVRNNGMKTIQVLVAIWPAFLVGLVMVRSGCLCMVSCVLLMVPESLRAGQCFSTVLEMKVKDGDGDGDGEQASGRH